MPMMITMTRTICLARPSIGSRLTRYRTRMTTMNVMRMLMSNDMSAILALGGGQDHERAAVEPVPWPMHWTAPARRWMWKYWIGGEELRRPGPARHHAPATRGF